MEGGWKEERRRGREEKGRVSHRIGIGIPKMGSDFINKCVSVSVSAGTPREVCIEVPLYLCIFVPS